MTRTAVPSAHAPGTRASSRQALRMLTPSPPVFAT